MRRALLITCAVAYGQDPTCVDDPTWVKNGDEPWKDCAWAAEYVKEGNTARGMWRCGPSFAYKGASARGTCGGGRSGGRRWDRYPPSGRRLL